MQKTAMASRRSGSTCSGNARKKKAYKAHFNPDLVKEWPEIIAKSHKGDTDAFCRLCRCDFSVSSGESKTCSVTCLIVTDADLPAMVKVKGKGSFYIAQNPVFSGSILARQQLRAKAKSLTFPPLSIARYSFIQLMNRGVNGENENAQFSKR